VAKERGTQKERGREREMERGRGSPERGRALVRGKERRVAVGLVMVAAAGQSGLGRFRGRILWVRL
jgi:hypothetical protein